MSTRCQIGFYEEKPEGTEALENFEALLYHHSDGYPEGQHGIIGRLSPILKEFRVHRALTGESEYLSRYVCCNLFEPESILGGGISREFHFDIEFYYAIHPDGIDVYSCSDSIPENPPLGWHYLQTVSIGEGWKEKVEEVPEEESKPRVDFELLGKI